MAINAYVNPLIVGNVITKSLRAYESNGAVEGCLLAVANIAAADGNGSLYRLFKNLNADLTITGCTVANTAMTTGTSYGLGLYNTDLSTVAITTVGYFSGVMDMTAAALSITPGTAKDGLKGFTPALAGASGRLGTIYTNRLFEHAGLTNNTLNRPPAYDMVMTATTASSIIGQAVIQMHYIID